MSLSYADQFIRQAYTSGKKEFTAADIKSFNDNKDYSRARKLKTEFKNDPKGQLDAFNKALKDYIATQQTSKSNRKGEAWELGFRAGFLGSAGAAIASQLGTGETTTTTLPVKSGESPEALAARVASLLADDPKLAKRAISAGQAAGAMMRKKVDELILSILSKEEKQYLGTITVNIGGFGGNLSIGDQIIEIGSTNDSIAAKLKAEIGGGQAIFDDKSKNVGQILIENKYYTKDADVYQNKSPYATQSSVTFTHVTTGEAGFYQMVGYPAEEYKDILENNKNIWHNSGSDANFYAKATRFIASHPPQSLGAAAIANAAKSGVLDLLTKNGTGLKNTNAAQKELTALQMAIQRRFVVYLNASGKLKVQTNWEDNENLRITPIFNSAAANEASKKTVKTEMVNNLVMEGGYYSAGISFVYDGTPMSAIATFAPGGYWQGITTGLNDMSTVRDNAPLKSLGSVVLKLSLS